MAYAPEIKYDLPSEGPHVAVLVDQRDLGLVPNRFEPNKPPRHMNRLVLLVDELGPQGQRLYVSDDVNLVRSRNGTLITYIRGWNHIAAKAPVPADISWETEDYIGRCVGVNLVHNGTWANVGSVFSLPPTATLLAIPVGYIRKGGTAPGTYHVESNTTPVNQPKPPQSTAQAEKAVQDAQEVGYIPF